MLLGDIITSPYLPDLRPVARCLCPLAPLAASDMHALSSPVTADAVAWSARLTPLGSAPCSALWP